MKKPVFGFSDQFKHEPVSAAPVTRGIKQSRYRTASALIRRLRRTGCLRDALSSLFHGEAQLIQKHDLCRASTCLVYDAVSAFSKALP